MATLVTEQVELFYLAHTTAIMLPVLPLLLLLLQPPSSAGEGCPTGFFASVGDKFFYSESEPDDGWDDALNECRTDTVLATFETQEEFDVIADKSDTSGCILLPYIYL